jgi:hypothetical protein
MPPLSSGTELERYFPLVDGYVHHYLTESSSGTRGVLIARARRVEPMQGSLQIGQREKRFRYLPDGVQILGELGAAYVLKLPLAVGARWQGEHGGAVTVLQIGAALSTRSWNFADCVVTEEQREGDRPLRLRTSYCAGVGIVRLEAAGGGEIERAELKNYGPALELGPDGVRVLPPAP